MSKKKLLLIDGSNRAYAAWYAYSRLSYKGKSVSMVYGLPAMVKFLIRKFEPTKVFVVWDERTSIDQRKKIYPEYKNTESRNLFDREDFERQKKIAKELLLSAGVAQVSSKKAEADDIIYRMNRRAIKKGYEVVLVSADKDFNQLLSKKTSIWRETLKAKKMTTYENCKGEFGYQPHQTVDYLIMEGDTSDNIKGYPGIGPKKAVDLLEKYDTLANFIKSDDKHSIIDRKVLLELCRINRVLIDLSLYHRMYMKGVKNEYYGDNPNPKINKEKWLKLCKTNGLIKFKDKNFLRTFKL